MKLDSRFRGNDKWNSGENLICYCHSRAAPFRSLVRRREGMNLYNSKRMPIILGTKIDDLSLKEVLEKATDFLANDTGQAKYIVTPNPEICLLAEQDHAYQHILNDAWLSLPDGIGLKLGAALLGEKLSNRVTGVDYSLALIKLAADHGWRIFLFGASDGVAEKCQKILEEKYQGVKIVGRYPGRIFNFQFSIFNKCSIPNVSNDKIIDSINQVKPDILLVALGAPLQEQWIAENLSKLATVKLAAGVGGTFDFIAGKTLRAPRLMRAIGLEWLWRVTTEPHRIKRIYHATLKFIFVVLKWRLRMTFVYRSNVLGLIVRGCSSVVERLLPKQEIAGSSPVTRSTLSVDYGTLSVPPQILLVERCDEDGHWQLPQGGVEPGETTETAIKREMTEEVGTDKFKIVKHVPRFFSYRWPKLDRLRRGYAGQRQDLFILEFTGTDEDIKLDARECKQFKWVPIAEAQQTVHEVRKAQVERALEWI